MSKRILFPLFVCSLAAVFLVYEFVLQVAPSTMTHALMRDFHMDAWGLGAVLGVFYDVYAPAQLFAGLSFDRFGPRKTLTVACSLCATGALFFGMATSSVWVMLGRVLMGAGSACAFVGVLFLGARWFDKRYFFWVAGLTELMGCLGAVGGLGMVAHWVHGTSWRHVFQTLGVSGVGLVLALWSWVRVPNTSDFPEEKRSLRAMREQLSNVVRRRHAWWVGMHAFLVFAPITAFAALWGPAFLIERYPGLTMEAASTACTLVWVGMGVGSLWVGWMSQRFKNRRLFLKSCALLGVFVSVVMLVCLVSQHTMWILLCLLGVATSGQSLSFVVIEDECPAVQLGTAFGFNNLLVVLSGAVMQPLVGWLLKQHWDGTLVQGTPVYDLSAFQWALSVMPLCYLAGWWVVQYRIRETHPEAR